MKYTPRRLRSWPRLVVDKAEAEKEAMGYLQLSATSDKLAIGTPDSKEFRLMQCLFSPQNFPTARYEPVAQTYERLYATSHGIHTIVELPHTDTEARDAKIAHSVERSLKLLENGALKSHLTFTRGNGRASMSIAAA